MNKLKILWLSEASFLSTGYATYTKEVLKRLHNTGKYDIVELASYSCQDDERLADIPWKVYPNMPMWKNSPEKNNKQEIEVYDAHPIHQFGSFRFEELCTKFHPNVVVMIRDVWMDSFVISSPFRDNYNILWMPTVDGAPQNPEWMSCYAECDALFTYSDWSIDVLKKQNNRLNILGTASPAADSSFRVLDKKALKQALGLETKKIIGTVMRNQKRKLFPDLFESFRKFLDSSGRTDVLLYCHTSYPDNHPWNIPELLNEHALSNHVLFTYICNNCNYVFPSHFNDYVQICEKCHQAKATTSSVQKGINTEQLVEIYNLFDLYVQYSSCFPKGTEIQTSSGWKNIEEIKIGDSVFTHKNRYQKVINTFITPNKNNILKIKCHGDYASVSATPEHPFWVISSDEVKNTTRSVREKIGVLLSNNAKLPPPIFKKLSDINVGDMLVYNIDDTVNELESLDLKDYLPNSNEYSYNDTTVTSRHGDVYNRYIKIDDEFVEFLGLFAADGHASKSGVYITTSDKELSTIKIATTVLSRISQKSPTIRYYKNRAAVDIRICSKIISNLFRKLCYNNKVKRLPAFCDYLHPNKQKIILKALINGDGAVCTRRGVTNSYFCNTSQFLASQVKFILRRLRINFNCRLTDRSKSTDGKNRQNIYFFEIPEDITKNQFVQKRHNSRNLYIENMHLMQIKSISKIEHIGQVYNFEVEHDNSYQTKLGVVHNCEGFGIPLVEAAACGVPVMAVDYSAMSDVVRKLNGIPLTPKAMYKEIETGRMFAVPDNDDTAKKFQELLSDEKALINASIKTKMGYLKHYNYDNTAQKYQNYFDTLDVNALDAKWQKPFIPHVIDTNIPPETVSNSDFVKWLFLNVLNEPHQIGSYLYCKLLKDINYGCTSSGYGLHYLSEDSSYNQPKRREFNRKEAFNQMKALTEFRFHWQRRRMYEGK